MEYELHGRNFDYILIFYNKKDKMNLKNHAEHRRNKVTNRKT